MQITRMYFNKLCDELQEPEISILLGARQTGKTTLLRQMEATAKNMGRSTRFFDLESSADLLELSGSDQEIVKKLLHAGDVIFIDEFHYLKNASKIFKEIYDARKGVKIIASGSSSLEIHKHLKESLAGRFRKTVIFPLTYEEAQRTPFRRMDSYLVWGGMPGLLHRTTDDGKMDLLQNIVSTYITKDIKALIREENVRAFNAMLYALAQNQGSLTVAANIARDARLTESTVATYLDIMSQTYVCFRIESYAKNLANELKKSSKCYLFDVGIRNSLLKDFRTPEDREDKGAIYESFVLQQLMARMKPNMELRFWRTKKGVEVDFILVVNRVPIPIEVKSDLKTSTLPDGIASFMRTYPNVPRGFVFNRSIKDTVRFEGREVAFLPFEEILDFSV